MSAVFLSAQDAAPDLRCPICEGAVEWRPPSWRCAVQGHEFPQVDGVPVLLNPARSVFRAEDFRPGVRTTFKDSPAWALRLGRLLPSASRDVSASRCRAELAKMLAGRPPHRRRVLVVGCGDAHGDYGVLGQVDGSVWVETDVSLAGRARVVCDASDLPFADGAFDLVICTAVLEHVLDPQRCVDEMHRVLREDGLVYVTTPFMQQVHMGEYDFTRFTHAGHRWLLRGFSEIDSGIATGPASVLVWSVEYFLLSWTGSVGARRAIKGLVRLGLGWLTWLDVHLARRAPAYDGAGGFYFIGMRAGADALSPRAVIDYYRGADALK
jgi:SAM-dependent methyltransferase